MLDASRYFPDDVAGDRQWNRNGHLIKYSLGKRSLAIDLQTPDGVAAFERLVPDAHVLIENFSPRVMPQFGLDEDPAARTEPRPRLCDDAGLGRTGPARDWLAYGSGIDSHAGLSSLTGYVDESPWKGGIAWPDPLAGPARVRRGAHATVGHPPRRGRVHDRGRPVRIDDRRDRRPGARSPRRRALDPGPRTERAGLLAEAMVEAAGDDEWLAVSIANAGGARSSPRRAHRMAATRRRPTSPRGASGWRASGWRAGPASAFLR